MKESEKSIKLQEDDMPKGTVIVVSAPSGTGKTTLCKMLSEEFKDIKLSVSFTTRAKRSGETEGVSYRFIRDEEFDKMITDNKFIEWANVFGKRYGTPIDQFKLSSNINKPIYDTLLEIDVQGAEKIMGYYSKIDKLSKLVTIFIKPPSQNALIERLKKRGEMQDEELKNRLKFAKFEIEKSKLYNYTITNDIITRAYLKLKSIIIAERCRNISRI